MESAIITWDDVVNALPESERNQTWKSTYKSYVNRLECIGYKNNLVPFILSPVETHKQLIASGMPRNKINKAMNTLKNCVEKLSKSAMSGFVDNMLWEHWASVKEKINDGCYEGGDCNTAPKSPSLAGSEESGRIRDTTLSEIDEDEPDVCQDMYDMLENMKKPASGAVSHSNSDLIHRITFLEAQLQSTMSVLENMQASMKDLQLCNKDLQSSIKKKNQVLRDLMKTITDTHTLHSLLDEILN
jgi:hypothetical protein